MPTTGAKADQLLVWWRARKRAFEDRAAESGKCMFCGHRPPTETAHGMYERPVYCLPCDRLLDLL